MKDPQKFWDKLARRYAKAPIRNEENYRKKLAITQEYLQPEWSVFEFGCGTGTTAINHAPHVRHVFATDISGRMLEIAEVRAREAGVENIRFEQGSLDSLALESESFDAVLGLNILHLLDDVEFAVARVHQLLRPGGIFVSSTGLLGEVKLRWRLLISLLELARIMPSVNRIGLHDLRGWLTAAGFSIDREWQPEKGSIFIVARKLASSS